MGIISKINIYRYSTVLHKLIPDGLLEFISSDFKHIYLFALKIEGAR